MGARAGARVSILLKPCKGFILHSQVTSGNVRTVYWQIKLSTGNTKFSTGNTTFSTGKTKFKHWQFQIAIGSTKFTTGNTKLNKH